MTRQKRQEKELDAELRFDCEQRVAEHIRAGKSEAEARRAVQLEFGGLEQVKEECREARGLHLLDTLQRELRYALRGMLRTPGFTAAAVVTLALGIGVNTAVFTVTKAALFAGFPLVDRNDRLVYMTTNRYCCVSWPDFQDWKAQAKSFRGMAIVQGGGITLSEKNGSPERFTATFVSAETFRVAGQKPLLGRDFAESDETPGASAVAMLSYTLWERRYGKDPAVVGRTVRIDGAPATLTGVMPQGFSFPQKQDLWLAMIPTPETRKRENRGTWFVFGRLADGVGITTARAEIETIGRRLASTWPLTNQGVRPEVRNFNEFFIGPNESMILAVLWGAVGFVLLIACANLANLMLARTMGRAREISVRIALGAGRWRIIRQLLLESAILSSLGGVLGWWIARLGVGAYELAERGPGRSPWRVLDYEMDYGVLGYLMAISTGTALLFGLLPALRFSKPDVNATLKDGGRGVTRGGRGRHLPALLVVAEMALAVVLLAGAGVMIRSFLNVYTADVGVKTANILTANLALPVARYPGAEGQITFYDRLRRRLEVVPGVESVTIASALPTDGTAKFAYELAGAPAADEKRRPKLAALTIGPGYFRTVGAAMLSGHEFSEAEGTSGVPGVIVNQRFAKTYWPGEEPLGKRLRLFKGKVPEAWLTVVGTVPDIVQNDGTRQAFEPLVYLPYRQKPGGGTGGDMWVVARTRVAPASLANAFRREILALDADLPVFGPFTLAERLEGNYWTSGLYGALFLIFALLALFLAAFGLYAVIAHSVSQRTQEIGIRMAIGATRADILRLLCRQGMVPVGIGLAVGLVASLAVTGVLKAVLVSVSPVDPLTLGVASAALVLAGMLGCLIPARRAMGTDPANAIRHG